jgi:hypothetical protein
MYKADLISLSVNISQLKYVAFINQVFHGFVYTQRNAELKEIQILSPRKKINVSKKVTSLEDFNKDVQKTLLDSYDRGEFPSVEKTTFLLKHKMGHQGYGFSTLRILKCL